FIPLYSFPLFFPYTTLFRSISFIGNFLITSRNSLNECPPPRGLLPSASVLKKSQIIIWPPGLRKLSALVKEDSILIYWKLSLNLDRKSTRLNSSHLVISYAV